MHSKFTFRCFFFMSSHHFNIYDTFDLFSLRPWQVNLHSLYKFSFSNNVYNLHVHVNMCNRCTCIFTCIVSLIHCLRTVRQDQSNKNHQVKKYMYITYKYIFQVINTLTLTVSFKTVKNELLVLSISVKKKTWPTLMN